jgi:hypothetical protein
MVAHEEGASTTSLVNCSEPEEGGSGLSMAGGIGSTKLAGDSIEEGARLVSAEATGTVTQSMDAKRSIPSKRTRDAYGKGAFVCSHRRAPKPAMCFQFFSNKDCTSILSQESPNKDSLDIRDVNFIGINIFKIRNLAPPGMLSGRLVRAFFYLKALKRLPLIEKSTIPFANPIHYSPSAHPFAFSPSSALGIYTDKH